MDEKIVAFDIGDVWTGVAISDALGLLARPYKTVKTVELERFLKLIFAKEKIDTVVVGYPRTLRGTVSKQTEKVQQIKEALEKKFNGVNWILWDERLTSKRAQMLKKRFSKEAKQTEHAIAAAFILDSYLEYRHMHRNT